MTNRKARRQHRRSRDRIAELRAEEGWSGWTVGRSRRMSRPTPTTWAGLRDIMGAAAWVAAWVLGITLAVGVAVVLGWMLWGWISD